MLGEVTVYMLKKMARMDLKYIQENSHFKIATWFRKFLAATPGSYGTTAVKYLNFPHMHKFNTMRTPPAVTNRALS
jgi:hypothetical protein